MRYITSLAPASNYPLELIKPGPDCRFVAMNIRSDNALVVVWETDTPGPICSCGDPNCPGKVGGF